MPKRLHSDLRRSCLLLVDNFSKFSKDEHQAPCLGVGLCAVLHDIDSMPDINFGIWILIEGGELVRENYESGC